MTAIDLDTASPPDHYDSLDAILATALDLFGHAVGDRHSPFHTPTVGTVTRDGVPSVRTVVLRRFDPDQRRLGFNTDRRSHKIDEIAFTPRVGVHVYDRDRKIQVRLAGQAAVHWTDSVADQAWAASRPFSRACYRIEPGTGSVIGDGGAFVIPEPRQDDHGRDQFAAVSVTFDRLEWLYLAASGHRRAEFVWNADGVLDANWLAP